MPRPDAAHSTDLEGYEVLVGVCGGIAAYKVCDAVSTLVQRGAGVTVAMTKAGRKFVRPLTFQALTGRRVLTSLWHTDEACDIQHISLTDAVDLIVVAPATANIIAKMAVGIADDLMSTLVLSAASPLLVAPAMNTRMWENPAVQTNCAALKDRGVALVGPAEGRLACGTVGPGRMVEAAALVDEAATLLLEHPPKRAVQRA